MSDGPWIKFYPSDWLTGTRGLSPAETGIYITLVAMMYEKGGTLVGDTAKLARLCNCPLAPFQRVLERLIEDGKIDRYGDGGLTNKRVLDELATRQKTSIAASQSAAKRWGKDKENQTQSDADAMRKASIAGAGQISDIRTQKVEVLEPLLFQQTEDSVQEDKSVGALSLKDAPTARGTRLSDSWVLPRGWGEWAMGEFPHLTADVVRKIAEEFRDYWIGIPGQRGRKTNWEATWRNRVREKASRAGPVASAPRPTRIELIKENLRQKIENEQRSGEGNPDHHAGGRLRLSGPSLARDH